MLIKYAFLINALIKNVSLGISFLECSMLQMFHDHKCVYMCAHKYGKHRSRSVVFVNCSLPEINTFCCLRISFMYILHFEQIYPHYFSSNSFSTPSPPFSPTFMSSLLKSYSVLLPYFLSQGLSLILELTNESRLGREFSHGSTCLPLPMLG